MGSSLFILDACAYTCHTRTLSFASRVCFPFLSVFACFFRTKKFIEIILYWFLWRLCHHLFIYSAWTSCIYTLFTSGYHFDIDRRTRTHCFQKQTRSLWSPYVLAFSHWVSASLSLSFSFSLWPWMYKVSSARLRESAFTAWVHAACFHFSVEKFSTQNSWFYCFNSFNRVCVCVCTAYV